MQDYTIDELGLPEDVELPGMRLRTNEERTVRAEQARHLWFFVEESGRPDNVAWLVRKFLARFRPKESWELEYAFTCDKLRVGAFGGGTLFVTAEAIHCTEDYLTQLRDQFRTQQSEAAA